MTKIIFVSIFKLVLSSDQNISKEKGSQLIPFLSIVQQVLPLFLFLLQSPPQRTNARSREFLNCFFSLSNFLCMFLFPRISHTNKKGCGGFQKKFQKLVWNLINPRGLVENLFWLLFSSGRYIYPYISSWLFYLQFVFVFFCKAFHISPSRQ